MSGVSFERLFSPRRTVIFGSVKHNKIAHQILSQMTAGGYTGGLVSVNPSAEKPSGMEGVPAFSDIAAVPGDVDLAVLAVPARFAAETLESCGKKGVPFAVVLTSGFSEADNAEGEKSLAETAARYGIRVVGPNCAGIMSTPARLFASIEERALPGRTALISQSGAVGAAVLAMAQGRGVGFSHFISIGNQADVDEADLLDYLAEDGATGATALYLESTANGRKFLQAASRFCARKPLILVKAGRSDAGRRAAGSHTGSMAGSDGVYEAACRQCGIMRVEGIEELLDLCAALEHYPEPRGRRLLIVTNSGGPGILTSDKAEGLGLDVATPSEKLKGILKKELPGHASVGNPIDLTVEGTAEQYAFVLSQGLREEYDAAVAINVGTPFLDSADLAEGVLRGATAAPGKPVMPVFMAGRIVKSGSDLLTSRGLPPMPTGERAAAALAAMASRRQPEPRDWRVLGVSSRPAGDFPEPAQVRFLEERGFPFPPHRFVTSAEEARAAAEKLSFPVVMKVVSPEILHKSDAGGVVLGIRNAGELTAAYNDMAARLSGRGMSGVMLYQQLSGGRECILGAKKDRDFGPVILAGAGGVMAELMKDAALRIAPLTRRDCVKMLASLKFAPLIDGFRGSPPLAKDALIDLMLRLSVLVTSELWIEELDLNPVFLFKDRVVIGDVRIIPAVP
ncbi:MAG: acetate--CoA ligase family protein [Spirochaetales bacterium]|nr:acetate--CoA ligase family protein [Spirochaetales bacterium]